MVFPCGVSDPALSEDGPYDRWTWTAIAPAAELEKRGIVFDPQARKMSSVHADDSNNKDYGAYEVCALVMCCLLFGIWCVVYGI